MEITSLRIGDWVRIKLPSPQGERLSIPMHVVGFLSWFNNPSPNDTVYLDFADNEGGVWEEEVRNLVKLEVKDNESNRKETKRQTRPSA